MLNNMGEIIPPCLTPLPTRKSGEVELQHLLVCIPEKQQFNNK